MYSAVVILVFLFGTSCGNPLGTKARNGTLSGMKRNLLQFRNMVNDAKLGHSAIEFVSYGCWCGFGGKGDPVDGIDSCCKAHDLCYDRIHKSDSCTLPGAEYWKTYNRLGDYGCDEKRNGPCQKMVCECDSKAVKCFKGKTFNVKNKNYSKPCTR